LSDFLIDLHQSLAHQDFAKKSLNFGLNKKALPRFHGEASAYNLQKNKMLMVMFAILLGCINSGFDNAVGHTNP
jgi:hypothetical protein